jgi:hypothetical protein
VRPERSRLFILSTFSVLSFVICTLTSSKAFSQFRTDPLPKPCPTQNTFNEFTFFRNSAVPESEKIPGLEGETKAITSSHKSAFLAAMLSLALPGLGEYYVGDQIWRGLIFTAIDAGLWYEHYHFIARGNDSVIAFHAFADSLWLPQKYADSLNTKLALAGRTFRITEDTDFIQINMAEDSLARLGFQNFTHHLPDKGSQQYYELISKYIQFSVGWKDFHDLDPTHFSPDYETHAFMRAAMNHQFEIADYFLYGLFLNRILSAIDAALLARDHNSPIHLEGELQERRYPDGMMGFVPTAKLRYTF